VVAQAVSCREDQRISVGETLVLGAQHAVIALVFLVYPLAAAQQIGLDLVSTERFLTACVFGMGMATCLHYFRAPIGSGSLAVEISTPIFLPTVVMAGAAGGLPLLAAVSLLCGTVEVVFARALKRVKSLFPAEVCGIAVMMLGVSIIKPGMTNALGLHTADAVVQWPAIVTAVTTLSSIVAVSILGSPRLKLLAIAVGLLAGVVVARLCGSFDASAEQALSATSWLAWPELMISVPKVSVELIPIAIVMALVVSVDNLGMLIGIQRQRDASWRKLDLVQAAGGIQVSGLGDIISGIFGGMPTGISSANVALAHATGSVARIVSLGTGILLVATAFAPKVLVALTTVPRPVVGAVMVYSAVYMVTSGMGLIHGRMLSDRRIFVIGFSLVMGLTSALLPGAYSHVTPLLRPIFLSPLATSTLAAMSLTYLLSFGAVARASFEVRFSDSPNESLQEFEINKTLRLPLERLGAEVGADRESLDRSIDVTAEYLAALRVMGVVRGPVQLLARFDDSRFNVSLTYTGDPPPLATVDAAEMSVADDAREHHRLKRIASNINRLSTAEKSGTQTVDLVFEA
jgi:xanthine permease XanP